MPQFSLFLIFIRYLADMIGYTATKEIVSQVRRSTIQFAQQLLMFVVMMMSCSDTGIKRNVVC